MLYDIITIVLCVLVLLAIAVLFMKLKLLQMTVQAELTAKVDEADIRKMEEAVQKSAETDVSRIEDAVRQAISDSVQTSLEAQQKAPDTEGPNLETLLQNIQKSLSDGVAAMSDKQFDRLAVIERAVTDAVNNVARTELEGLNSVSNLLSEKLDGMSARMSDNMASLEKSTNESVRSMSERQAMAQEQSDKLVKERLESMSKHLTDSQSKSDTVVRERLDAMSEKLTESQSRSDTVLRESLESMQKASADNTESLKETVKLSLKTTDDVFKAEFGNINNVLKNTLERVDSTVGNMSRTVNEQLNLIRKTVDDQLSDHLDKRLTDSFSQVSSQLESVYQGLGEMQTLAKGVGDLKKVLASTKTRGVIGGSQLRAIITDTLTPEQYAEHIATVEGSSDCVEFAVKLPTDNGTVWLPIDANFQETAYAELQDAYASGDTEDIETARELLRDALRDEASAIMAKYVHEPETTSFGVMFLPFEGLYAEAVNMNMVEELSRNYNVNIAGPSTMAALICSLQMSFRTIAIQKRSQEVWEVLSGVQAEFDNFSDVLEKVESKIAQAGSEVGKLRSNHIRAIEKKLRNVDNTMSLADANKVFGIETSKE